MKIMKHTKQTSITYKREKGKMEISGDPKDVKGHIWFDQISSRLVSMIPAVLLFWKLPMLSWLTGGWLKSKIPFFLILFVIPGDWLQILMSG